MGIDIVDGRQFRKSDSESEYGAVIFTESTQKRHNFNVGGYGPGDEDSVLIAGVCKDFHFPSIAR